MAIPLNPIQSWLDNQQKEQEGCCPKPKFYGTQYSAAAYKLEWRDGDYKSVQGDTDYAKTDTLPNICAHTQNRHGKD